MFVGMGIYMRYYIEEGISYWSQPTDRSVNNRKNIGMRNHTRDMDVGCVYLRCVEV